MDNTSLAAEYKRLCQGLSDLARAEEVIAEQFKGTELALTVSSRIQERAQDMVAFLVTAARTNPGLASGIFPALGQYMYKREAGFDIGALLRLDWYFENYDKKHAPPKPPEDAGKLSTEVMRLADDLAKTEAN